MTQEEILMTLVQGEDGRVWASERLGWSLNDQPQVPVCDWKGISCFDGTNVSEINLQESNFVGSISRELGQLKSLKSINAKQNIVQGTIPPEFAALPNVVDVDLSNNRLTGPVPKFQSKELSTLRLADNILTGTFPKDFGDGHPKLREVDAIRNQLSGGLPDSFGMLSSLSKLSLSENKLYGTIPQQLGYLPSLEYLYIDLNEFVGTVPRSLTPPNSPLKEVWFQGNMLSGTVPAAFAEMKNLVNLYVDGNKFTGQLPQDLCKPEINADFFEGVESVGVPDARDYCASIACPVMTASLEGVWPCSPCESGTYSPYLGREGSCIPRDEAAILHLFWQATNGNDWTGENNWYYDGVDKCDFTGIACNENKQILAVTLPSFGLRGSIPQELGFLEHLERLDLSNNQLYGYLPSDLREAPLDFLDVGGNKLVGVVPPMLCLAGEVNGNGLNGDYNCDTITCPSGTYSPIGRAGEGHTCKPCGDRLPFMGRRSCGGSAGTMDTRGGGAANMSTAGKVLLSVFFLTLAVVAAVMGYVYYARRKKSRVTRTLDDMPELTISDNIDMEARKMPPPSDPLYMGTFPDSVEVEEMHDDDFSSVTRVKKKKGKKKAKKRNTPNYDEVVQEDMDGEDAQSAASNPVWLDVPKLDGDRSPSPTMV